MGTITLNYVAPILKTLFGNQSDFKLIIEDLPAFELAKDVSNFKLDLAIVPEFDYGYPELNYIRVSNPQELFCFAAQNHPIFRKNKTTLEWADIVDYPLVVGTGISVLKKIILGKFITEGLENSLELAAEVHSLDVIKNIIETSDCLGFSIYRDLKEDIDNKRLRIINIKDNISIAFCVLVHKGIYIRPTITRFISMCKQAFEYKLL